MWWQRTGSSFCRAFVTPLCHCFFPDCRHELALSKHQAKNQPCSHAVHTPSPRPLRIRPRNVQFVCHNWRNTRLGEDHQEAQRTIIWKETVSELIANSNDHKLTCLMHFERERELERQERTVTPSQRIWNRELGTCIETLSDNNKMRQKQGNYLFWMKNISINVTRICHRWKERKICDIIHELALQAITFNL